MQESGDSTDDSRQERLTAWEIARTQFKSSTIFQVRVDHIEVSALHGFIHTVCTKRLRAIIANANVHCLNLSLEYPWLRRFLNSAEINFCDGAGLIWAGRLLGFSLPSRITYADWIWDLAAFCEQYNLSLFFLGAAPDVAAHAADALRAKHPRICILGTHHGYFNKKADSPENKAVIDLINQHSPDILVLGFGMPLQENWLMEFWPILNTRVALTGGAVFDYASGNLRRASPLFTCTGFEWLGRLLIEPRRLWKRYLIGNPLFVWRVLQEYRKKCLRIYLRIR